MYPRFAPLPIGLVVAFVAGLGPAPALGGAEVTCSGLEPGPTRTVTRIIDGETVVLDDARELRLIGALTPRASDAEAEPGAWPVETAATEAIRNLVLGKTIALGFAGERTDRYGRLRAHVFVIDEDKRRWVQGYLLEHGFARAYTPAGDRTCNAELLAAEHAAREARRGVWAEAAYQVRPTDKPGELLRYRTTFQVIEGKVAGAAQVRGTIYLNFDRNWRRGFSISLRREDSALLGAYAGNPKGLEGRDVRVRGWIDQRGSAPVIDLSAGGAIEVAGEADAQARPPR